METISISKKTARRFVLGRQGLWPGRRWSGKDGTEKALRAVEAVQMDPLNVIARSHDITLWGRIQNYQSAQLEQLLYQERAFFDYGGALFIYPMSELPYWRLPMRRREQGGRWADFATPHQVLLDEVRAEIHARGPLGNRNFSGRTRVDNYRGRKDSALAMFYLWLTGELMIHHREGFQRVYDFRENIAPAAHNWAASDEEAEIFFASKSMAFSGLIRESKWGSGFSSFVERPVSRAETSQWLKMLSAQDKVTPLKIEGSKDRWLALTGDVPLLSTLESGNIPHEWQPLSTTTKEEVVFLAPLDIVSARGRASQLFDFEYIWEVYKPVEQRRWGYYTLPILYDDRLVARLDPKLDRKTSTLLINGFWLEDQALGSDLDFAQALGRGLAHFMTFLQVQCLDISAIEPAELRIRLQALLKSESSLSR
ncbi:MAG TPA: crosslink repair DNA glycosylase YcaQ family protein [Ktedonobacteraceae bacterium]|nr:crosslink repair DNA glycosylase YcaQ family protein [Ktedonobacteraceae bacterium]